jgi:hypothetical protein
MTAEDCLKLLNEKMKYEGERNKAFELLDQIDGIERVLKISISMNEQALALLRNGRKEIEVGL